jgi:hypothetical protein
MEWLGIHSGSNSQEGSCVRRHPGVPHKASLAPGGKPDEKKRNNMPSSSVNPMSRISNYHTKGPKWRDGDFVYRCWGR